MNDLHELLLDLSEYFDSRADADWDDNAQRSIPNREMRLCDRIREILAQSTEVLAKL